MQFSTLQKWFLMPLRFGLYDKSVLLILVFVFVDIGVNFHPDNCCSESCALNKGKRIESLTSIV